MNINNWKPVVAACAAVALLLPLTTATVQAQTYPERAVRLLVSVPAGAGPDVEARQFAAGLSAELGQPVVIENRPGFAQLLAIDALAKATPDGYTLAMGSPSNLASHPRLFDRPLFNVEKDIVPVSLVGEHPWVLYVNANLPVKNMADFIALAKSKPGQLTYASTGVGSFLQVTGEWFQKLTGTSLRHVPYGASNWLTDLLAGHVDAVFYPLLLADNVKAGKLRALAISSKVRSPLLPDVPTFAEAGVPDYVARAWFGMIAPAGTPPAILEKLASASARAVQRPAFREFMAKNGALPVGSSAPEFARYMKVEQDKWRGVINEAGIKLE